MSTCYWFQGAADSKQEASAERVLIFIVAMGEMKIDCQTPRLYKCTHDNEIFGTLVQFSRLLLNCVWFTWNLAMWIHDTRTAIGRDDVAQSMAVGVAIAWRQFTKNNTEVIWSWATPWRFRFQDIICDLDDLHLWRRNLYSCRRRKLSFVHTIH